MENHNILQLNTEEDTAALAKKIAAQLPKKCLVFLKGDLGAGKTTFVRYLLHALGYEGSVKSPTFTLVEPYEFDDWRVFHFDLYRIHSPEELDYIGIQDYFAQEAICLIEWPERAQTLLPQANYVFEFELLSDGMRRCVINTFINVP